MEGIRQGEEEALRLLERKERAIRNIEANPYIRIVARLENSEHFILRVKNPEGEGESTVDFFPSSLEWVKRKSIARGMGVGRLFSFFKLKHQRRVTQ